MHATVPIIAVFTKYDYFKEMIETKIRKHQNKIPNQEDVDAEADMVFKEQYLRLVDGASTHVRLASRLLLAILDARSLCISDMDQHGQRCDQLIEATAHVLQNDAITAVLLAKFSWQARYQRNGCGKDVFL